MPIVKPQQTDAMSKMLDKAKKLTPAIHDLTMAMAGSISAEHGLGRLRRDEILRYKSAIEIEMMRSLKRALDPRNIMNPGKVILP